MEALSKFVSIIGSFAWGPIMIVLLFMTALILSVGTKIVQYRKLGYTFKQLFA